MPARGQEGRLPCYRQCVQSWWRGRDRREGEHGGAGCARIPVAAPRPWLLLSTLAAEDRIIRFRTTSLAFSAGGGKRWRQPLPKCCLLWKWNRPKLELWSVQENAQPLSGTGLVPWKLAWLVSLTFFISSDSGVKQSLYSEKRWGGSQKVRKWQKQALLGSSLLQELGQSCALA